MTFFPFSVCLRVTISSTYLLTTMLFRHASPKPDDAEPNGEKKSSSGDEKTEPLKPAGSNSNGQETEDALTSDQNNTSADVEESPTKATAETTASTAPEASEESAESKPEEKAVTSDDTKSAPSAPVDTDMADAVEETVAELSTSETKPAADEPADKSADEPAGEPAPKPADEPADEPAIPTAASEEPKATEESSSASDSKLPDSAASAHQSAPTPSEDKGDIEMRDAPAIVDPASSASQLESTQDTSLTDVPPATPGEDSNIQASIAVSSQRTPPAASATDAAPSDGPLSAAKLSRAREDDGEDEPLAKRAKVEEIADEVQVKPMPDAMDVDTPSKPPAAEDGTQSITLSDPALDSQPITQYQSREIRKILALVKKTRAGGNFKISVEIGWPALWEDYQKKVTNPMDLSTMEKKLRGDLPSYGNMRDFKDDVELIYVNSIAFNGATHDVTASAKSLRDDIFSRLAKYSAAEPPRQEKKESIKHHPTRHTEPRAAPPASQPAAPPPPRRQSKPAAAANPVEKPVESPAFAIPPNNNGMPLIRRDSTKNADDRPKRPVNPPKNKDITYEPKKKRKVAPELKFCDEVITELKKAKYNDFTHPFMFPVDPVALNIPHYHKIVKKPMDIQTMGLKLKDGEYSNAKEFEKDIDLIVKNCRTFNGENSSYTELAVKLEALFKQEWAKKDEWVAKHTPAAAASAASATSPTLKDDSDEEDEVEAEPQVDAAALTSPLLQGLLARLKEEEDKMNAQITSTKPDPNALEIAQTMANMLRKQVIDERIKLAAQAEQTRATKQKSSKKKANQGGGKKASGAAAAGSAKKSSKKAAPKRKLSASDKDIIVNGIGDLEGGQLEKAIDIIKKDTGQGENDSGELELDIESLSDDALLKLYDIITKAFPALRTDKDKHAAEHATEPASASKSRSATKPKKNKPMSKSEQDRRIQQLAELRAQAARQNSGSQEPIESIEGNGAQPPSDSALLHMESEDEESSEEE